VGKLGSLPSEAIARATYQRLEPTEGSSVDLDVLAKDEIVPLGLSRETYEGVATELAAESLVWASTSIGFVVRDEQRRYHAIRTSAPRPGFGDRFGLAPTGVAMPDKLTFIRFVLCPTPRLMGHELSARISAEPCFVREGSYAKSPATAEMSRRMKSCRDVSIAWRSWWDKTVKPIWPHRMEFIPADKKKRIPPPPEALASELKECLAPLLGKAPAQLGVMQVPNEVIAHVISIDPFDATIQGQTEGDFQTLVTHKSKGAPPVAVRVTASGFGDALAVIQLVETAIHESAHYRHKLYAVDWIRQWRRRRGRTRGDDGTLTGSDQAETFMTWLQVRLRRALISEIEYDIVKSAVYPYALGTHPLAQVEAFLGAYPSFPREKWVHPDEKRAAVDPGSEKPALLGQARFVQLAQAAPHWQKLAGLDAPSSTVVLDQLKGVNLRVLCAEAVTQASRSQDACRLKDMQLMLQEFIDRPNIAKDLIPFLNALSFRLVGGTRKT
jgi:hypothetical protein